MIYEFLIRICRIRNLTLYLFMLSSIFCDARNNMYYILIKSEQDKLKEKYQSDDILDLLNKWETDKKKKDYYPILDELLDNVPLSKKIKFFQEWKNDIPRLSKDFHEPDGLWWGRSVRRGEIMIEEAITLHFWHSFVNDENLLMAQQILPQLEMERLRKKHKNSITYLILWESLCFFNSSHYQKI